MAEQTTAERLPEDVDTALAVRGIEARDEVALRLALEAHLKGYTLYRLTPTAARRWKLATRWWEPDDAVDRNYFRVITSDQQVFELYYEAAPATYIPDNTRWVLDVCQD
jgi:uncharacterized protein DUF6504